MSGGLSHRLCSSQWHCPHLTFQGHPHTIHHSTGFVSFVFPPQAPPPPPSAPALTPKTPKRFSPTHSATTQYLKWSRHSTLVHPQRQPRGWMRLLSSSPQRGLNLKSSLGLRSPQSFVTLTSSQPNHQSLVGPGRPGRSRSRCHVCVPTTHCQERCPVYTFFFAFPSLSRSNPHSFVMTVTILFIPVFPSLTTCLRMQYSAR
jgi:hypothetical protein